MKHRFLFLLMMTPLMSLAQTSAEILNKYSRLGLPLVCITTADGTEPTSDGIQHPEGHYVGESITNVVPKEARMQIYRADTLWYDSGEYEKDKSGIKIKHRGNTSAYYYQNKPFKLSLQKKADLIEPIESDTINRKSKDWVLLNGAERLHVYIANQMSCLIDMEYTPRMEFVNVIINNDYRGIYMLSENVKRDKGCRIDVDKDEGYIIELDAYFWNESLSFPSTLTSYAQWTLKYPKAEDITEEQEADIRKDIIRFEKAISASNYPEVIDVQSFARWILLHDILGSYDTGGSNKYIARQNQEPSSLMRMPVGWDMGSSMKYPETFSTIHTERGLFFSRLFANEHCQNFPETYVDEWKRVSQSGAITQIRQFLQSFPSTSQGQGLTRSYPLHAKRWHFGLSKIEDMTQAAIEWFTNREGWLNSQITDLANGITTTGAEAEGQTGARKVTKDGHLYILKNGETYSIDGKRIN